MGGAVKKAVKIPFKALKQVTGLAGSALGVGGKPEAGQEPSVGSPPGPMIPRPEKEVTHRENVAFDSSAINQATLQAMQQQQRDQGAQTGLAEADVQAGGEGEGLGDGGEDGTGGSNTRRKRAQYSSASINI